MDDDATADGLGEVLVALSKYREEGQALYPSVFLCEDLEGMLAALGGREHLSVGRGPFEPVTMRKALKQCAPLGGNDWSIYLVRRRDRLEYGLFRTDAFILSRTAMATLRELVDERVRIIGLVQLAESVLELRGSRGGRGSSISRAPTPRRCPRSRTSASWSPSRRGTCPRPIATRSRASSSGSSSTRLVRRTAR